MHRLLERDFGAQLGYQTGKRFSKFKHSVLTDSLRQDFFDHPKELSLVNTIQAPYRHWLQASGLSVHDAEAISNRVSSYFVYALNEQ